MTSTEQNGAEAVSPGIKKEKKGLMPLDTVFLVAVLIMLAVGLMMLFSAGFAASLAKTGDSYNFIRKQLIFSAIGVALMFVVSVIPVSLYRRFVWIIYGVANFLLVLVYFISNDSEKRWIYLPGGGQFQPSELAKFAVIVVLAYYISAHKDEMKQFIKGFVIPMILVAIPTLLVLFETHLSGAIQIFAVGFLMIVAGGSRLLFCGGSALAALGGGWIVAQSTGYMSDRISVWLDPTLDLLGKGHQPYQSLLTIGSGGLLGLGYGKSRQKYLFLPEPQNDCIFAVISEEVGFVGVLLILVLFSFFIWRGLYIAMKAKDTYSSLLAFGIIALIGVQIVLNLAVVTNSIPTTGISLPFFSYGGTSLLVLLVEMGVILRVSRDAYLR